MNRNTHHNQSWNFSNLSPCSLECDLLLVVCYTNHAIAFTTRNVWNLPHLNCWSADCWSADHVPMQDRLTFDEQLSNISIACFSIESRLVWNWFTSCRRFSISEIVFLTFWTKHSLRLSSIGFDIFHYIKEIHFWMLMIVLHAYKKDLQKKTLDPLFPLFSMLHLCRTWLCDSLFTCELQSSKKVIEKNKYLFCKI